MRVALDLPWMTTATAWTAAVVAALGAHVCLLLLLNAPRVQASAGRIWRSGGAVSLGTGLWASQVLLLGVAVGSMPGAVSAVGQAIVWLLAVVLALVACDLGGRPSSTPRALAGSVAVLAVAAVLMPVVGLSTVQPTPPQALIAAPSGWAGAGLGALLAGTACGLAVVSGRRQGTARLVFGGAASAALAAGALLPWVAGPPPLALGAALGFGPAPSGDAMALLAGVGAPATFLALLVGGAGLMRQVGGTSASGVPTDPVTSLPNREAVETRLAEMAHDAETSMQRLAVLIADIDGFRLINESLGHATGDELLRAFAQRLRTMVGTHDVLGRLAGDKFILLVPGVRDPRAVTAGAARLVDAMQQPVKLADREVSLSCSVGVALFPDHGAASVLIGHADRATAAAKRSGGATHCLFESHMAAPARDQVDLVRDLRRAIEQKELELYYQPKVHAPTGEITGAEALMRWRHPQRGMVSPGVFIPIAERFGLIGSLGNWVIDEACRQARAWRDQGLRMRVAINLSVQQMRQEDVVERLRAALQRHGVNPRQITCEITETAAMDDTAGTKVVFERLEKLGVHISIDDFGTGYSSLAYLRKLRAEELKIDQSFVADLETSADARAIVDAVVKLALALGMKVVAEGVETEGQQRILRALGCNELQGYLFAKPMSAKSLALWAMEDIGPRSIGFRPSLFTETDAAPLDFLPTRPQDEGQARRRTGPGAIAASRAVPRNATH